MLPLAAVAFFLIIVIPYAGAYRADLNNDPVALGPGEAAAAAPAVGRSVVSAASVQTVSQSVSYLGQRLQELDGAAIVVQETPSQVP